MAKIVGFFVCLLIISLDIAAGFCGIEAEIAQNKPHSETRTVLISSIPVTSLAQRVKHLKLWIFECRMKPSDEAFKLGLAAAGLLILAHLISNLFGGCSFLCSRDDFQKASSNRQLTTACLLFSWLILVVGLSTLAIGTLANHKKRASCGFTDHHMLTIGGILCFVHGLFSIAYYVCATSGGN